jgi:hypothetical protein
MNNYRKHFDRELKIMRDSLEPEEGKLIIEPFIEDIYSILDKFAGEGHSGASAPHGAEALSFAIKKACMFEPLSPIMGTDDEWNTVEHSGPIHYQNNRLSSIFKDTSDSKPYYLNAIVWQGEDKWDTFGGTVWGVSSSQTIKSFPFTPKTFYVDVYRERYVPDGKHKDVPEKEVVSCGPGDFVYFIKDEKQLEEVFEYYDRREK